MNSTWTRVTTNRMDLVSAIVFPKNAKMATVTLVGIFIALGLIASNSNRQNLTGLSPLNADTTVVGPFSHAEIQKMWEEWRLNYQAYTTETFANNIVFNSIKEQVPFFGNALPPNDGFFSSFPGLDTATIASSYGYGWFVTVFVTNSTNGARFLCLYKVVNTTDPSLTALTPVNMTTYPLTTKMQLAYIVGA